MNEDGDETCPLCTEKMDPTDQQLKACKCGYEICVWCWHRIIGMAEKENTEGQCPACRTPYNKERIVAKAANCERMVAVSGRKQKSEKAKSKTSAEARMHLSSVRVVQRKVVYIVGLPINLSDESLLERKEFFGQYGKVLKVSISRPTGAIAQNASIINTFNVYITYGREEEAIRCIQAVHNFVMEGKTLRACFGTAKYCHAWLRNMTCSNRNCLYLHEMGSQEESLSKDEIVSAYTRSRVPKIPSNYLQQRFGDVLPPPVDGYSTHVTSDKTITKNAANNAASHVRDSNSHAGKCIAVLPAVSSRGLHRAANFCPPAGSIACSQTSSRQKGKSSDSPSVHSSVTSGRQISTWHDENFKASSVSDVNNLSRPLGPLRSGVRRDCSTTVLDVPSEILQVEACASDPWDDDIPIASNIPEERLVVHMSGAQPVEPATCNAFGDIRRTISDASSRTISDASSSSVMSKTSSSAYSTFAHDDKETGLFVSGSTENMMHMSGARTVEPANFNAVGDFRASGLDAASMMVNYASPSLNSVSYSDVVHLVPEPQDKGKGIVVPRSNANLIYNSHDTLDKQGISSCPDEAPCNRSDDDGSIRNLCSSLSSFHTDRYLAVGNPSGDEHVSPVSNFSSAGMAKNLPSSLEQSSSDNRFEGLSTVPFTQTSYVLSSRHASRESSDWSSSNLDYPVGATSYISSQDDDFRHSASLTNGDSWTMNIEKDIFPIREDESILSTDGKSLNNLRKSEEVLELAEKNLTGEKVKSLGRFDGGANFDKKTSLDVAGSSIISDIFSLDFEPWDDSLSSANSSLKLLRETNKEDGSLPLSTLWKSPISNQSRFSFAREENPHNQLGSIRELSAIQKPLPLLHDSYGDRYQNSIRFSSAEGSYAINRGPVVSSVGHSDLSWAKISVPPGFSSTNKAPPGFSFQDKCEQAYRPAYSENSLHNYLGHQYQVQQSDNMSGVEYIDPEILSVGRGHMPLESVSSRQNRQLSEHIWGRYFPSNEAYSGPLPVPDNCNSPSIFANLSIHQPKCSHILSNHQEVGMTNRMSMKGYASHHEK